MSPFLHHVFCPNCKKYTVHDAGVCLTCKDNDEKFKVMKEQEEKEKEKEKKTTS